MTSTVYPKVSTELEAETRSGDSTTETGDRIPILLGSAYDVEGQRLWAEGFREKSETPLIHFGSAGLAIGAVVYTGNQDFFGRLVKVFPGLPSGQELAAPNLGQTVVGVDPENRGLLVFSGRVPNEATSIASDKVSVFDASVKALAPRLIKESAVTIAAVPVSDAGNEADTDPTPETNNQDVLVSFLKENGHRSVADRIERFLALLSEDPDEPPIVIESLRSMVGFIVMVPNLETPIVGSDPEGLMELEWHLPDNGDPDSFWGRGNGVVSLKFLTSGLVQYVALSGPHQKGIERLRKQGESTRRYLLSSLGEFTPRITRG